MGHIAWGLTPAQESDFWKQRDAGWANEPEATKSVGVKNSECFLGSRVACKRGDRGPGYRELKVVTVF